ncbi:WD40 repeat domain-containing protein [Streptomyces sp. NPDC005890]|uniref:WD40 repeat domain-containing protein n=1 Tax=Streptomyces sp. NPDC005890 TaxID=3154568 RepID=UPI0034036096
MEEARALAGGGGARDDEGAGRLGPVASEFLSASVRHRQRVRRIWQGLVAVLSALAVAVAVVGVVARVQSDRARQERNIAIAGEVRAEADQVRMTDASLAAQLDVVALRMQPTESTELNLLGDEDTPLSTVLTGHRGEVNTVDFSPDGHVLASGDDKGEIWLWNTAGPGPRAGSAIRCGVSTSRCGECTTALPDTSSPPPTRTAPSAVGTSATPGTPPPWVTRSRRVAAGSTPSRFAFQPGGRVLAVAAGPEVQLWDVTDAARPRLLGSPPGHADDSFLSVAFTPGGDTMASGNSDGTVPLWNVSDPSRPRLLGRPLSSGSGGQINGVAISPDGRTLVAVSNDGGLRLWDVVDPARPRPLGGLLTVSEDPVNSVVFSPNSHMLATSGDDAVIHFWDIRDRTHPRHLGQDLTGHRGTVSALAFSSDGRSVVSGGSDRTLRLWDVRDPDHARPFGMPIVVPDYINTVTFSRDGRTLFIGDGSYTVRILPMTTRSAVAYICRSTGNVLTPQLWHKHIPHLPYHPPCAQP